MDTPKGFRPVYFTDDDEEYVYPGIVRRGAETWSGGLYPYVTVDTMAEIVEKLQADYPTAELAHAANVAWYDLVPMLDDYYEVVVYEPPSPRYADDGGHPGDDPLPLTDKYDADGYPEDGNAWGTLNLLDDPGYAKNHPGPKEWIDLGSLGLVWHEVSFDEVVARVYRAAETAYMADAYGEAAWRTVARFLLKQGHSEHEAMAIMRSKHARWADDSEGAGNGRGTNSAAFRRYYERQKERGFDWKAEGVEMALGTPRELGRR